MRYYAVLSTLAVGQAAAVAIRHAPPPRSCVSGRSPRPRRGTSADETSDYSTIVYSTNPAFNAAMATKWGSSSAAATAAAATTTQAVSAAAVTSAGKSSSTGAASASSTGPAATAASGGNTASTGDTVTDVTAGVSNIVSRLGLKGMPINAQAAGSQSVWIGNSSAWTAEFVNNGGDDVGVACWEKGSFSLNANIAPVLASVPNGKSLTLSFKEGVGMACSAIHPTTKLMFSGGVYEPWYEITFGSGDVGTFDLSLETNTVGRMATLQGSQCTASSDKCFYRCTSFDNTHDANSCFLDYELDNGCVGTGTHHGGDWKSGGCSMGQGSEHLTITLH